MGTALTTLTVTSTATTTTTAIEARSATSTTNTTTGTTTTATDAVPTLCNGKADIPDCYAIQSQSYCRLDNMFGAHLRETCPVVCASCVPTSTTSVTSTSTGTSTATTSTTLCNGLLDPADCREGMDFCQRVGILGIFARKHCPNTCNSCFSSGIATAAESVANGMCVSRDASWTDGKCMNRCGDQSRCHPKCLQKCSSRVQ